jgi:Holliday junction resolvase RusA-like endonuclease
VTFLMPRPKGHFRTGKRAHILREAAPLYHTSKPDATKLLRATEDALTGILWHDDAQIAMQIVKKRYTSSNPGAEIKILPWIEGAASNVDLSPQDLFA